MLVEHRKYALFRRKNSLENVYARGSIVDRRAWQRISPECALRAFRCLVWNAKNARFIRFHQYEMWIEQFHNESLCCFVLRQNVAASTNVLDYTTQKYTERRKALSVCKECWLVATWQNSVLDLWSPSIINLLKQRKLQICMSFLFE